MSQGWRHFPHAQVWRFYDADTLEVEVDAGFGVRCRPSVRLFGLSAPEITGAERNLGLQALAAVRQFELHPCQLWTWKQSFNRYVGRVVVSGAKDLARLVLMLGLGRAWDGKTDRPAFPVTNIDDELTEYDRLLKRDYTA